jgi:glyoxylase-like metal-dependent hydrolase (beta-lactamase superfamily II)
VVSRFARVTFASVADGVYVAHTQPMHTNVSLVVGDATALVIDTLCTGHQAEALVAAVRAITPLPLTVLNTHSHFDHTFGNAVTAAGGRPIWAHPNAAAAITASGADWQRHWEAAFREHYPEFADWLAATTIQTATHPVRPPERLDLGGRSVTISYHGRGHTDGDIVARVDDTAVLFAGDLVEQGGPPAFGDDSYPLDWPEALAGMLREPGLAVVVPGHGSPVDPAFVASQHAQLAEFAWLIRDGHADGATPEEVAARAPWPAVDCLVGVERGFAALDDPVPEDLFREI